MDKEKGPDNISFAVLMGTTFAVLIIFLICRYVPIPMNVNHNCFEFAGTRMVEGGQMQGVCLKCLTDIDIRPLLPRQPLQNTVTVNQP